MYKGNAWNKKKFVSFFEMMDKIKMKYSNVNKLKDDVHDTTKVIYLILLKSIRCIKLLDLKDLLGLLHPCLHISVPIVIDLGTFIVYIYVIK